MRSTKEAERVLINVQRASPPRDPLRNGYGNSAPPPMIFCYEYFVEGISLRGGLQREIWQLLDLIPWLENGSRLFIFMCAEFISFFFPGSVEFSLVKCLSPVKFNADHSEM